ncbi:sporulation-specific protein 15-like isoform X1 [Zingiber officinale]|uniref:sporulation-specific protein 15-like isoform X1 n=2 Tax=Zingiber officinale TaxID=94328 RepID=UPI001C4B1EB0|nr:sporulation-specific protein 15-like isoform X1 [Zingiber officinale]XP_042408201.1 sporulation-specific protein 15-like isoform X1 [Zingiber officinale]XP_042408202.1 sporulation-specific protein 15-like isoform X1 [Zingiber officinale]
MSRIPKWKIEKTKVKVVFRLQFHATHIPQQGWDKLFISLIPIDVGKTTAKTNKVNVRNGSCKWPDPIYETTRLLQDAKTKTYDEKLYNLLVATGSSRSSFLGEVNINLADFADALRPSSVLLPLTNCDFGTILHVTVQLLTSKTGFREFEQQRELSVRGIQMISSNKNIPVDTEAASPEIVNEVAEKANLRVRFKQDRMKLPSLEQVGESNEEYEDSAGGVDGSSFTSESLNAEKNELQGMHEIDSFSINSADLPLSQRPLPGNEEPSVSQLSAQGRNDWTHGWSSNFSVDNDLTTAYGENNRFRVRLEVAESAFLQLKLEARSLQRITDELGAETKSLSEQLLLELASGEQLSREVSLLKSENAKFRDELEALKSSKAMLQKLDRRASSPLLSIKNQEDDLVDSKLQDDFTVAETHFMYHDLRVQWLESLLLMESNVQEIRNKARLGYCGSDFDLLGSDFEFLGCLISDLKKDIIQVKSFEKSYGDNTYLGGAVHCLNSRVAYHQYDTLKKDIEVPSLRGVDRFDLLTKLEHSTMEKESLTKKLEQMQCYYESLILELEENQKQTVKELENLRNEHSSCLYSTSLLQNQIEKLNQEMNEQYMALSEDRNNLESQNREFERRAIASETALNRVRWNYSIAVDRLQKDLQLLSFQVLSMYETNENLAKQTLLDDKHYDDEWSDEPMTYKDGIVTTINHENYQSSISGVRTNNGLHETSHKYSPHSGTSTSVSCKDSGVPHMQLQSKDDAHVDGFGLYKIRQQAPIFTQVDNIPTADLSTVKHIDEFSSRSLLDDAVLSSQRNGLYAEADRQNMTDADDIQELRKSLQRLEVLHSDTEAEALEMYFLNVNLKVFSDVLLGALHDAYDGVQHMKEKVLELAQQLQHATEGKENYVLKLHKAVEDSRILMDDNAKCISRCQDLTLKNQILEAKLEDVLCESTFHSEKIAKYEKMFAEFKAYETMYNACIEERNKFKSMLNKESQQKQCLQTEMRSMNSDFKLLKEEFDKAASENDKMQTCIANIQEKLRHLSASMISCNEQINCFALDGISVSHQLEAGNYVQFIASLEQFQQEMTQKILQLLKENMNIMEERDISQRSQNNTELNCLNMKQKFESDINAVTEKLVVSNALVEKLQKELQNASEKLKISSDTEEKTESINRELSSKLATLEMELQQAVEENKDLVNQLILLASVKEDLEKTQISLTYCMEEKRSLLMSIQSKNEASTQMENEIYSLKQSLQLIQRDMQTEKRMRKGLDDAVASLSAQLEEKECQLLSLYEGKMEVAQLQDMILELERTSIGYKDQLMKSEESRSSLESENSSLKVEVVDVRNQLAELLETSLASEIEVTIMRSHLCDRMQDSFVQLKTVERKLEEMTLKNADLTASLDTLAEKESLLIDKNGKLSIVLQSLQSDFDIIFREKESLIDYVNKKNAELEEVQLRAATVEADSNCHMKKYESEICQLKNIMIFCEEEVCNLRSSRDALEITNVVLKSKLEEQHRKISLLEDCESQLRALQEHNEEFSCRLSEQVLKTEEYKNLSNLLREQRDKAEAECLQAREKKENERSSQESLRIAFIKEQYESKIQELKNQSFVSKKYAEEMLLKLQNALDEVESRKKTEVSLVKKFEDLSEKISNLECELVTVLTERKELAKAHDRITNELECTVLNLECCREKSLKLENSLKKSNAEKLKLEDSLKECNEEKNNVRVELDLVKRLFENLALDGSVNHEGNSDSDFPSITSIEQILQDDSFELSAVFEELPNYKDTNLGIDASTVDFTNSPKNTDVGVVLPTIADEKSCSYSPPNSTAFKDTESALGQQSKFTDNITDITDIEEHFKEQQKLMSGIGMLQKELEKLRNENLSSLIPLEEQFLSSHQILERDLSQLDLANEQLGSIFPLFKELPESGNALERVLALELELAEALQSKKISDFHVQSSFLKQHDNEALVFQSFRHINELIKEMLELKTRYTAVETELKEMQGRYSQLSLQFAEVEGERQKLVMTLKARAPTRS